VVCGITIAAIREASQRVHEDSEQTWVIRKWGGQGSMTTTKKAIITNHAFSGVVASTAWVSLYIIK
jgi:hypothetical protein